MQGVTYPCAYAKCLKVFSGHRLAGRRANTCPPFYIANVLQEGGSMFDAFGLYKANQAAADRKMQTFERIKQRARERAIQSDKDSRKKNLKPKA